MKGPLNRRKLCGLLAWFLSGQATVNLLAQHPPGKSEFKPFGEPCLGGFLKGNDFRQLSDAEKTAYLMGIWDGYMFAPAIGGKSKNDQILNDCIPNLQADQLLAIVNKYMDEHPEQWGEPMNFIVYSALPKSCRIDMLS